MSGLPFSGHSKYPALNRIEICYRLSGSLCDDLIKKYSKIKLMKIPKKSLTLLALIMGLVLLAQQDDNLSSEANMMLDSIKWESPSNAYLYLLGMSAELGTDPILEGEKTISEIRVLESTYLDVNDFDDLQTFTQKTPLVLPEHEIFCSISEPSCIYKIFSYSKIDLSSETFEVLENRYLTLLGMEDLHSLTMPHFNEHIPLYSPLVKANRLVSLNAIYKARNCCPREASESLYDLIELLSRYVENSDTLIGKMIGYALLNETIEVLSMLLREFNLEGKGIKLLSKEQLSFNKAINREFAFARSVILIAARGDKWKWVPEWVEKIGIKENMTSNASVPLYRYVVSLSESSQLEFKDLLGQSEKIPLKTAWFRNFFGTLLNQTALPNYEKYVARGFDLNAKISLFNEIRGQKITPEILKNIPNPYYNDSTNNGIIDAEKNRVCFDGPLEDPKYLRCISLAK